MKTRFCATEGSVISMQQKSTGVLILKSVFLIFVFYFLAGPLVQASPCTQKPIITIDPCYGGGSGSGDDWAGGNDFETFPVFGERIGPGTGESRGGGPNLGNLGSLGRGPGDRGEPGGASWSGGKEDKPKEDEKPRKRNCVLFDGVFQRGQILGVSTKSCSSLSLSGANSQSVEFAVETYSETTQRVATDITNKTIESMAPEYSNFSELTQEINANLTGISEAAIGEFLNQTMAQMSVNLSLASIDVGADFQNKMKNYLLDQVNFEVQRIGGGPSLFIVNQGSGTQNFSQDGTTSFASPHGGFREKVKDLSARLDEINPQDLRQTQAKDLARTTLKIADEENYLGNDDVADQAFDMATELTDFAAGFVPGLSTAKDAYELFTGINPITGKSLSRIDRILAGFGLITLGSTNLIRGGQKAIKKLLKYYQTNQESQNFIKQILKFIKESKVVFNKKEFKNFLSIIQNETGSISLNDELLDSIRNLQFPKLWTVGKYKDSVKNAFGHYRKHGKEFTNINSAVEYVEEAHRFIRNPPSGTLSKVRSNGDTILYNPNSDIFAVRALDGAPKTMFKPDPSKHGFPTNMDYFNAQ